MFPSLASPNSRRLSRSRWNETASRRTRHRRFRAGESGGLPCESDSRRDSSGIVFGLGLHRFWKSQSCHLLLSIFGRLACLCHLFRFVGLFLFHWPEAEESVNRACRHNLVAFLVGNGFLAAESAAFLGGRLPAFEAKSRCLS